jgi:hypothetical protein
MFREIPILRLINVLTELRINEVLVFRNLKGRLEILRICLDLSIDRILNLIG